MSRFLPSHYTSTRNRNITILKNSILCVSDPVHSLHPRFAFIHCTELFKDSSYRHPSKHQPVRSLTCALSTLSIHIASNHDMSSTPSDDGISKLIREVGSQFQRSGADLQALQNTIQDHGETEKVRNEMLQDARSVLQGRSKSPFMQINLISFGVLLIFDRF